MSTCLISLGSNLGDRTASLDRAMQRLSAHPAIRIVARSGTHATKPVGGPPGQPDFLNAAVRLETSLAPAELLQTLQLVEEQLGRQRSERWAARSMDLDLLLFDDVMLQSASLELPHPRMAFRRFILVPAVEIAGEMIHPPTGWTLRRLLDHLDRGPDYVAITGVVGPGKTTVAQAAAEQSAARLIADSIDERSLAAYDLAWNASYLFVEQLQHRRDLLCGTWESEPCDVSGQARSQQSAISDFWFDETVPLARRNLAGEQWNEFERAWVELHQGVPAPKLLVVLDAPAAQLAEQLARNEPRLAAIPATDWLEHLRADLLNHVSRIYQGPILKLDACDPRRAIEEVAAAIQAMR